MENRTSVSIAHNLFFQELSTEIFIFVFFVLEYLVSFLNLFFLVSQI